MTTPPQTIDEFVTWVLDQDPSLEGIDPDVRQQLEADYVEAVDSRITRAIFDALTEDQVAEMGKLLDSASTAEVQDWVAQRVPNNSDIVAGVLLQWKDEYLGA